MYSETIYDQLPILKEKLQGDFYTDLTTRVLYSTDASVYRETPLAVSRPRNIQDIKTLIEFAQNEKVPLIPRAAGTSLAGQVVGNGIVMDFCKYFNKILEVNPDEKWVRVQPGVVLEELNIYLKKYNLFFAPETSTANRCTVGGMLGNNSCGLRSLVYGSTRDHTLEVKALLSDGSEVAFSELTKEEFEKKCNGDSKLLETQIYQNIKEILSYPKNQKEIEKQFPEKTIKRRNNGYAIDLLLDNSIFSDKKEKFNFCKLLAGSEGTLSVTTEIKLNLVPLPPKHKAIVAAHFNTLEDALKANLIALEHKPTAIELMDDVVMNCTKGNIEQQKNRFFIKGNPKAILIIEFARESENEIIEETEKMEANMRKAKLGYHFPLISPPDINRVWNLRKAGLGILANIPSDEKSTTIIEDTAIAVEKLPEYIAEFKNILKKHNLTCVFYAHIGTGELHLRPMLNLKKEEHIKLFETIGWNIAKLVKKYNGSLSGEHGDGRLRGIFTKFMLGEKIYSLFENIKKTWDKNNILNPEKIINTPPITSFLRYENSSLEKEIKTTFDFSDNNGILQAAERCNGSADCRKSVQIGGTMCPSFMATRDEYNSTRARANLLREFLTNSTKENPFDYQELYDILDQCLSCKACKSECPSSVDMAKLKAEFLQNFYEANGFSMRTSMIANFNTFNYLASLFPRFTNFILQSKISSNLIKKFIKFAPQRKLPKFSIITLQSWYKRHKKTDENTKKVYLFCDEFTNSQESDIGIKTILLLEKLGCKVVIPIHKQSGRSLISKGLLKKAQIVAIKNVELLQYIVTEENPLIGIEPSTILSFRDEYPDLVTKELKESSKKLAKNCLLLDEFIAQEIDKGNINSSAFKKEKQHIKLHGHCQQKAISSTEFTKKMLSLPENYTVEEIPSGCCGMAGSFGYEAEHYELSMKVGELVLFPNVRKTPKDVIIAAAGLSCRQQIEDGTKRKALHPAEILYKALK